MGETVKRYEIESTLNSKLVDCVTFLEFSLYKMMIFCYLI